MARKQTKRDHIKDATAAHADLNTFAAVVVLLESGLNHAPTYASADQIIKIAKREQGACLRRMDLAILKATQTE